MQLANQSILTELTASGRLPSPTGVALQILELSRDPDSSTEDMAMVLQGDPALAGQVLKYANSADSETVSGIRGEASPTGLGARIGGEKFKRHVLGNNGLGWIATLSWAGAAT